MKKIVCLLAIASVAFVSCKKEDASSKINSESVVADNTSTDNTVVAGDKSPVNAETVASKQDGFPVVSFNKVEHDFGDVKKGSKNETEFEVKNTGVADLVIINASASCGCTVPEYQKTPIKPGETSKIKVAFSANSVGAQSKTVTLTTNTEKAKELLTVKANVKE